jgi:hypothetical protein
MPLCLKAQIRDDVILKDLEINKKGYEVLAQLNDFDDI